ncbi:hypothetical protein LGV83_09225 [Enterococcus durans]|nr:hypothetical protein [Enterococcus durans]MCG3448189.1 hypothetical protein [Enterococcus durans]MCM6855137.1 hypothetical protein [Enterococcus durans]MCT4339410.1 hypothetical protein [Enterococcus durans]MDB1681137.1 hypothetical protein [Enterococcus durans]MDB1685484.1 hypothetical protein [Enterococcus durans]
MSAYLRRSCFCSHRLFVFKEWDKSVSYFCPMLVFFLKFPKNLAFGRLLFKIRVCSKTDF